MRAASRTGGAIDEAPVLGPEPLLRKIGTHLRQARDERGEDVRDVAEVLRIRTRYLLDLEEGELDSIPGRAYALGFLRTYADYLGFDGEAIVEEVRRAGERLPQNPSLRYRQPLPERQRPPLVLVGVSVLLAAIIYAGWSLWQHRASLPGLAQVSPPADEVVQAPAPDPVQNSVNGALSSLALPDLPPVPAAPPVPAPLDAADAEFGAVADVDGATAASVVSAILDGPPELVAADGAIDDVDPPEAGEPVDTAALMRLVAERAGGAPPQPFGDVEAGARVLLVASEPSWVQVRSQDQAFVWTRTMAPGDVYFVPNRDDLALWTGNAGGLTVILDGEPLQPIGANGQVRRDISLAADRLHSQFAQN